MKKLIILTVVLFCSLSLFAFQNRISAKLSPYAVQIMTSSEESDYQVVSKYGIGADVSYKRFLVKGLFVEGGVSWNTYLLPEGRKSLSSLMPFVGAGYDLRLSRVFKLGAHVDFAADSVFYKYLCSENLSVKTGLECGFFFNERIEVTAGCDGVFGFSQKNGTNYTNYRIVPMVGIGIGF